MLRIIFSLLLYFHLFLRPAVSFHWSYGSMVSEWGEHYPECDGKSESPINIETSHTQNHTFVPFSFSHNFHDKLEDAQLVNTGHSFKVNVGVGSSGKRTLRGGGLSGGPYELAQFHFHFGSESTPGSEHTINHLQYPAEIHFVFVSTKLQPTEYGYYAVLGFLLDVVDDGSRNEGSLSDFLENLHFVSNSGDSVDVSGLIDLSTIIPLDDLLLINRFYRYKGSLTTPPCTQVVEWTIFRDPILLSIAQYMDFLFGQNSEGKPLEENFRPVMPLNGRTVYKSTF